MDSDLECFDDGAPASPVVWFGGFEPQPDPAAYRFEDIGYEAADPALQAALWSDAMHVPGRAET